ncbi:hypothetical protein EKD04_012935 [Chloroflexales bacterium ZM16-3]|nr:hypothetical protein [Chloroflexales bacterium ZM16-3]
MTNIKTFAHNRNIPVEALENSGMYLTQAYDKVTGSHKNAVAVSNYGEFRKYRFVNPSIDTKTGKLNRFHADTGYTAHVRWLDEAIALAPKSSKLALVLANGEVGSAVARYYGIPAFCVAGGEGTFNETFAREVAQAYERSGLDKKIILAVDNDGTGYDSAATRAKELQAAGLEVYQVDFSEQAKGFDIENWVTANRDATNLAETFQGLAREYKPVVPEKPAQQATRQVQKVDATGTLGDIQTCLNILSPDMLREPWAKVGMVLYNELGDDGYELWREWSEPGNTYDESACISTWRSFKGKEPKDKVRIGSLIRWATEANNGINPVKRTEIALDAKETLLSAPLTDAGNAQRFTEMYKGLVRYNHTSRQWLIWSGKHWQYDNVGRIHRFAIETARAFQQAVIDGVSNYDTKKAAMSIAMGLEDERKRKSMLSTAQTEPDIATEESQYDADTMLLGVDNGVIDLRTGDFREARQNDYITKLANVAYTPGATCQRWERFMLEVFNDDPDIVKYVQRAVGYSLTGDTREQVMFLLYGNGRNGKSTFLETMAALLGDYGDTTPFNTFDASSLNEQTNDLAALKGARFVSIVETDEDRRLNESKVKLVTGQDRVKCRFLNKEFFTYKPQFKIWLAVNHKPQIRGTDLGIWRRIQTIPFTVNFTGREDKELDTTLRSELPGILNWALEGLRDWLSQGLNTPTQLVDAATSYRKENDIVEKWLDDQATIEPEAKVSVAIAYQNFGEWMKLEGYRYTMTKDAFSKRLAEKGFAVSVGKDENRKSTRFYTGFICGLITPVR